MKAIVQRKYGPATEVLHLGEVERPGVADDEVLVRVRAASVHADVWHVVTGFPHVLRLLGAGLRRPKQPIPGTDLAGEVVEVGKDVTEFRPGDEVFGESLRGMQWANGGTFAEYAAVPAEGLAHKPANVSFEQAATVPTAGIIALHNLKYGEMVREGHRVLVNGAAGGVGSIALQVAKARDAHVTGVDSAEKLDLVLSLGADEVVDYTRRDVTEPNASGPYDLIFDVASTLSLGRCKAVLAPTGKYVWIGHDHYGAGRTGGLLGSVPRGLASIVRAPFSKQLPDVEFQLASKKQTLAQLKELLEAGRLTPVVDRTFPLEETPAALQYLQTGQARGRIVVTP